MANSDNSERYFLVSYGAVDFSPAKFATFVKRLLALDIFCMDGVEFSLATDSDTEVKRLQAFVKQARADGFDSHVFEKDDDDLYALQNNGELNRFTRVGPVKS